MYHKRRTMKRTLAMAASLLLLGVTVGGSVAYLLAQDDAIENVFTPSGITTDVEEELGSAKEHVKIKNSGDTTAWIRAAVMFTWQDSEGNVYPELPVEGTDYIIGYDLANGWVRGNDGFYYWTKPVAAGASTGELIAACSPVAENTPENYGLNVQVVGSGIQYKPAKVFNTEWAGSGLTANDDCTAISREG